MKTTRWGIAEAITIQQAQVVIMMMDSLNFYIGDSPLENFDVYSRIYSFRGELVRTRGSLFISTYLPLSYERVVQELSLMIKEQGGE